MKANELNQSLKYVPWLPKLRQVPHLTIETNMTCNISCRSCYNVNKTYVKSYEQVCRDVDIGLKKRNVDTLSLLGGEPILHPDILRIIAYVKSKGVVCQLLSNGYAFLKDSENKIIDSLIENGLHRLILHIDKGQKVYRDPKKTIHTLLSQFDNKKIRISISWTIYNEGIGGLSDVLKEFSHYKNFDGILSVLEKDIDESIKSSYTRSSSPELLDEYLSLKEKLNLEPSLYLPSNLSKNDVKWLLYLYFVNVKTFRTFYVSPMVARLFQRQFLRTVLRKLLRKRQSNLAVISSLLITGMIEILWSPKRFRDYFYLLKSSRFLKNIKFQYFNIQDGPFYDAEHGKVSMCFHCPDATIRNGKITPVCFADRINPLPKGRVPKNVPEELIETVYGHLEELTC